MNPKYRIKQLARRVRTFVRRPILVRQQTLVPLAAHGACENPIFILGPRRSGTSLVRRILDSHSAIACPPETYFLTHFLELAGDRLTGAGLEGFGVPAEQSRDAVRRWASLYHEAHRVSQGKRRWADKTPRYLPRAAELESLFGPGAQYVLVVRHPLSVAQAVAYRGLAPGGKGDLGAAAQYVATAMRQLLEHRAAHPDRCWLLYYERLMATPHLTLRSLFGFLGERWEPSVLHHERHPHGFGNEDPIVRGTRGLEPHYYDPATLTTEQMGTVLPILAPVMELLGYSPSARMPRAAADESFSDTEKLESCNTNTH